MTLTSQIRISLPLLVVSFFILGCTTFCGPTRGELTPEQVVETYLDSSFNMTDVSQKDVLLDYATGNLRAAIEDASPETIKKAYIDRKYNIVSYQVVERRDRTPRETEITFRLVYVDVVSKDVDPKEAPQVTTENTVSVIKEHGVWRIRDVIGQKTAIDFPVSEAAQITAQGAPTGSMPETIDPFAEEE